MNPDFDRPEKYGISPNKARNLALTTSDGVRIGAWHVLPDAFHRRLQPTPLTANAKIKPDDYDEALRQHPTIIYLHGNAANRAAPFRTAAYAQFTSRLQANVIAIDYRGFGDSEGVPSEEGLVRDAKAAWDYVQSKSNGSGSNVVIVGQSLGTGVGSKVTRLLVEQGTPPQALMLIAPYLSLRKLVPQYRIGGLIPILSPAMYIPFANTLLDYTLKTVFASDEALPALLSSPPSHRLPHVIISHATDDEVIPYSHGELLFESILKADLHRRGQDLKGDDRHDAGDGHGDDAKNPASAPLAASLLSSAMLKQGNVRTKLLPGWARIEQFTIQGAMDAGGDAAPTVTLIRAEDGGHNTVGEGIVDIAGDIARLAVRE